VTKVHCDNGRISGFTSRNGSGQTSRHEATHYVLTTPLEVTRRLIDGDVQRLDPELGDFEHLQAAPMAALHLVLKRKLDHVPPEHVFLHQGRYGLSFIDVSQHWPDQPTTHLSCISSNFIPLRDLSEKDQLDALLGELCEYLGITPADVQRSSLKSNVSVPLFINTIGAWPNRAGTRAKRIDNLYFAGDWAKNPIDLACMEGAVSSALLTAQELGRHEGLSLEGPLVPKKYPPALLWLAKWLLVPVVAPVWAYAKLKHD
jgi:hypothetical protein